MHGFTRRIFKRLIQHAAYIGADRLPICEQEEAWAYPLIAAGEV